MVHGTADKEVAVNSGSVSSLLVWCGTERRGVDGGEDEVVRSVLAQCSVCRVVNDTWKFQSAMTNEPLPRHA
jgi:hypothetical protein